MFDTLSVSREAGLEHTTTGSHSGSANDFEADLERIDTEPTDGPGGFERYRRQVRMVDEAIAGFHTSQLLLIDILIEALTNGVWATDGSPSLPEWLAARYRMSTYSARILVKIATKLPELPCIREAYENGRLSWDQFRALVNVATPETDAELAETAPDLNPAQIKAIAREVTDDTVAKARDSKDVTFWFHENEPLFEMKVVLPDEEGATFITALARKAGQIDLEPQDGSPLPYGTMLANALIRITSESLASDADHDRATLLVKTDIETLLGLEGSPQATLGDGTTIPATTTITNQTLKRLACDARIQLVVEDPIDGVIGIGRTSRTIPGWLSRIVRTRDKGCRFPECERTLWLQAHHIHHWSEGGPTDLDNLITLCGYHHRLIHHDGWAIDGNPNHQVTWITKWGTKFERHPRWPGIKLIKERAANPRPIEPWYRTA